MTEQVNPRSNKKKVMKKQAWLYQPTEHMKELVEICVVEPSDYYTHLGLPSFIILTQSENGRPILLLDRGLYHNGLMEIKVHDEGKKKSKLKGLSRAPFVLSADFLTWNDFKSISAWKEEWFYNTEQVAEATGNSVDKWFFSLSPLYFNSLYLDGPIQAWNGKAWKDWKVQPI